MLRFVFGILCCLVFYPGSCQYIDTCYVNDTVVYKSVNQQSGSLLFWEVSGGVIISENPSGNDSVVVIWGSEPGFCRLSVYEHSACDYIGETVGVSILLKEREKELSFYVPNVFTPNNDDDNDFFCIKADEPPERFSIEIVSRWGAKVFKSNDFHFFWDGNTNGRTCSPGVYFYYIIYSYNGANNIKKGFVHLFR